MSTRQQKNLKSLEIDSLHDYLCRAFSKFSDTRRNNLSISISDALMSGYALFSLKDPSLLFFNNKRTEREGNMKSIYKVEKIPSDSGLRTILDEVDWDQYKTIYKALFRKIKQAGILKEYSYFRDYLICSIDGVHFFSSEHVCCDHCLEITKSNGKKEYRHCLLSAVLVHPDHKAVLPLVHEPIVKQDGKAKNDCERNSSKRLLPKIKAALGKEKLIIVEDALGSNGPHLRDIATVGFHYVIGVKPKGNKYLFGLVERLDKQGKVHSYEVEKDGLIHQFRYVQGIPLNTDNKDILVNFLEYRQIDPTGKQPTRHFTWITDLPLNKRSLYPIMRIGRSRWKIENETFNTLKNQGYHFEHSFGHGEKHLSTNFALLMMLAFLVDQLQQGWNYLFKAAWNKNQTKVALWETIRQKFNELPVKSMEMIYRLIIGLIKVKFQFIPDTG